LHACGAVWIFLLLNSERRIHMMDSCVQNKPPMNPFIEDTRCSVGMQTAEGRSIAAPDFFRLQMAFGADLGPALFVQI